MPLTPSIQAEGSFIVHFSNGVATDRLCKAQSLYISPLGSPGVVQEKTLPHFTPPLGRIHPGAPKPPCEDMCCAVH
jgi:hypothetical protein